MSQFSNVICNSVFVCDLYDEYELRVEITMKDVQLHTVKFHNLRKKIKL